MIRTLTATTAAALILGATPAIAKESRNAAALDAHFVSLETDDGLDCFEFDKLDAPTRQKHCESAIKQLESKRAAKRDPSVGEVANFDYRLVSLQAGLGAAYAQQDGTLSQRTCSLLESNVTIRGRLKTLPETELSASSYQAFQNPPSNFYQVVAKCREVVGTPPGAAPLPN